MPSSTKAVIIATSPISPPVIESMPSAIMGTMAPTSSDSAPTPPPGVVLGLGANLGDPLEQLRGAVRELGSRFGPTLACSGLYRSAAIGPEQPDFYNAAVLVPFAGELLDLLRVAQTVERTFGRVRRERWGPRTLDVDLLWAEGRTLDHADLVVPHPRLVERAFAILPLVDLVPHAVDPTTGEPYAALLGRFHSQRIERIAEPGWQRD